MMGPQVSFFFRTRGQHYALALLALAIINAASTRLDSQAAFSISSLLLSAVLYAIFITWTSPKLRSTHHSLVTTAISIILAGSLAIPGLWALIALMISFVNGSLDSFSSGLLDAFYVFSANALWSSPASTAFCVILIVNRLFNMSLGPLAALGVGAVAGYFASMLGSNLSSGSDALSVALASAFGNLPGTFGLVSPISLHPFGTSKLALTGSHASFIACSLLLQGAALLVWVAVRRRRDRQPSQSTHFR